MQSLQSVLTLAMVALPACQSEGSTAQKCERPDAAVGDACPSPGAPDGLVTTTVTPSTGRLRLVWSRSDGATSYRVKRSSSRTGAYAVVATVTEATYLDTGLVDGVTS